MRKKISEKNIFPEFNLYDEYFKIESFLSIKNTVGTYNQFGYRQTPSYTIEDYIDQLFFNSWNLRGTFTSLSEMRNELGISKDKLTPENITEESILDFLQYALNCVFRIDSTIESCNAAYLSDKNILEVIIQNSQAVLRELNCKMQFNQARDEIFVTYNDEIGDVVSVMHPDIKESIVEYKMIDNKRDLNRKGEILCTLSKKIESVEGMIKGTEYQALLNDTTFLLNKTGARHWVEKDKLASATFLKMQPKELEKWYDTTFDLIVSCLAVLPYLTVKNQIKAIRQTEVTANETTI